MCCNKLVLLLSLVLNAVKLPTTIKQLFSLMVAPNWNLTVHFYLKPLYQVYWLFLVKKKIQSEIVCPANSWKASRGGARQVHD